MTTPIKWVHPGIRLERDVHFLCYQLCRTVLLIGLAVLAVMLLDIWLRTGLFFDPEAFQKNKLLLPVEFSKIMGPAAFGMTILFYLRARLPMDLRNDEHNRPTGGLLAIDVFEGVSVAPWTPERR